MLFVFTITTVSFVISNIASVFMVQAENRSKPVLAGVFEAVYALLFIVGAKYSVSIGGANHTRTFVLICAIIIGNFLGAFIGTKWGDRFIVDHDEIKMDNTIAEHEASLALAHQALEELVREVEMHHELDGED
jgi:hypothetical protein